MALVIPPTTPTAVTSPQPVISPQERIASLLKLGANDTYHTLTTDDDNYYEVLRASGAVEYYDTKGKPVDIETIYPPEDYPIEAIDSEDIDAVVADTPSNSFLTKAKALLEEGMSLLEDVAEAQMLHYTDGYGQEHDYLTVISKVDYLSIDEIIINRGNCQAVLAQGRNPLGFGDNLQFATTCNALNIQEVVLKLSDGRTRTLSKQ